MGQQTGVQTQYMAHGGTADRGTDTIHGARWDSRQGYRHNTWRTVGQQTGVDEQYMAHGGTADSGTDTMHGAIHDARWDIST